MRKVLFVLSLLFHGNLMAAWNDADLINQASFTLANPSLANIKGTRPGDVLRGVILSTETKLLVNIYDSSGTSTNQIASLGVSTVGIINSEYIPFNVRVSSGLTISISGNTKGVTFIYLKVRPE